MVFQLFDTVAASGILIIEMKNVFLITDYLIMEKNYRFEIVYHWSTEPIVKCKARNQPKYDIDCGWLETAS